MYWIRGNGAPGPGEQGTGTCPLTVPPTKAGGERGGAARITAKKIRPACTPSNLLQRPGGRQAGVPRATPRPSPASLIQSAAHSKIRAQAIPLFLLSQFSLSSSPIQNCTALTQHNTHPLTPSTHSLPPNPNPTQVSTSYFFVITAKSKVLLVSAATRLALFPGPPIGPPAPPRAVAVGRQLPGSLPPLSPLAPRKASHSAGPSPPTLPNRGVDSASKYSACSN